MTGNAPPRAPPPKMLPLLAVVLLLMAGMTTTTKTTEAFAFSPTATTPPSSSRSCAAASRASAFAIVTRSAATNDDAGDGGAMASASSASSASAKEVEANASRARETPTLTDEDRSFVSSLCAQFGVDDDVDEDVSTEMMDEISRRLDAMPPRLLVALQMAGESLEWKEEPGGGGGGVGGMTGDDFEAQMVRVGRSLRRVLDGRLDSGRRLLEEMLRSGEIRKLDALIGRSAREGKLDTSFFQVLSVNMRDAAMNGDDEGGGGFGATPTTIAGSPGTGADAGAGAGADRKQILQHVYTRCQEELEKNVPPGIGLLNKLLRTEVPSIRDNQLRHYLGPQATSITSPDGKVIELPNVNSKPLVSHVEFGDAISDAVSRIRDIERSGGTDKLSASSLVENVRRIAAEARSVLASVHGEGGDVVVEFQGGLQPVFRPGSSAPPADADANANAAAAAAASADPTATSATAT